MPIEGGAGDLASVGDLASLQDVDDGPGCPLLVLTAKRRGLLEHLGAQGSKSSTVASDLGSQRQQPLCAVGPEPAPEGAGRDKDLEPVGAGVAPAGGLLDRVGHTAALGLDRLGDHPVAKGRDLETSFFLVSHPPCSKGRSRPGQRATAGMISSGRRPRRTARACRPAAGPSPRRAVAARRPAASAVRPSARAAG